MGASISTSTEVAVADPSKSADISENGDASTDPETTATQATVNEGGAENTNETTNTTESTSKQGLQSAKDADNTDDASDGPETATTPATDNVGEENTDITPSDADTSSAESSQSAEGAENTDGAASDSEATTFSEDSQSADDADNTDDTSSDAESTSTEASQSAEDAESSDTSSTAQNNTEEAKESAGSTGEASTENGSCIEVTLPDVLGIGKCLQANLDLCQNENTLIPGVMTLVNCTVTSLFNNLTPKNFLVTVKDILVALISKLVPGVVRIAETYFDGVQSDENRTIANGTCEGEIKIGIPNSLGKCLDKTIKLCEKGKPIDISVLESLVKALGCILRDLLTTAPHKTLKNLLCDLVRLVGDLIGTPVKTAVTAFCSI